VKSLSGNYRIGIFEHARARYVVLRESVGVGKECKEVVDYEEAFGSGKAAAEDKDV